MFDVDSAAKYTLKVMVEDVTKPIDLNTSLESIPDVKVYDVSKLFTSIEAQTRNWLDSRSDPVTVEVHRPDGHLQVLAKSAG